MLPLNSSFPITGATAGKPATAQDDRLSYIRRRNKALILVFFALIILLAIIISGIILHLIQKHNSRSQSLRQALAIQKFCTPSNPFSCINSVKAAVNIPQDANPNQIFTIALEHCVKVLSAVISTASDGTRPRPALRSCTKTLGHALGQLNNILGTMRVNSEQIYAGREGMIGWIEVAAADLAACGGDLEDDESTAVDEVEVKVKVHGVGNLLRYSRNFLVYFDDVNADFQFALPSSDESWGNLMVEDLCILLGPQYLVLVLLFFLLLRIQ